MCFSIVATIQRIVAAEVAQFWYLYEVDSIEVRTLFYCWKMCLITINIEKIQKVKFSHDDADFVDI